jgi:lipoprotein-anchoring transpeptidase ErfK/SrfK
MGAHMRIVIGWLFILILALPLTLVASPASAATTLREGSRGSAVVQLQARLTELRYDVGPIDGNFGRSTKHAVIAFQKVNGLTRDGIVGPKTHAALKQPVAPRVRRVRTGTYLEVDLTRQVVLLANNGKVTRIIDTSTGKASTPTPVGTYRIERRIDGYRTGALGTMWRPAYFHRGYAFHGYPSVPTHPASHGCVRMTNPAMNRLWSHLKIGTTVQTYR